MCGASSSSSYFSWVFNTLRASLVIENLMQKGHELIFGLHRFLYLDFRNTQFSFHFDPNIARVFFSISSKEQLLLQRVIFQSCNMSNVFEVLNFTKIGDIGRFCNRAQVFVAIHVRPIQKFWFWYINSRLLCQLFRFLVFKCPLQMSHFF